MNETRERSVDFYALEYEKLKEEQAARIGLRDNLLYATLVVVGGIVSFAVTEPSHYHALLVLPWATLILGWTYLANDHAISAIGRYFRRALVNRIAKEMGGPENVAVFGYETEHRVDARRRWRKIEQLFVDEVSFVASGLAGLATYWYLVPHPPWAIQVLMWIEAALLVILGAEILVYADLRRGT